MDEHTNLDRFNESMKEDAVKKWINLALIGVVGLLSIAAGGAKLAGVPSEAAFFEALGLSPSLMVALGTIQLGAGLMTLIPKARVYAAFTATAAFLASSLMIFVTGNTGFAAVSLLPVTAALYVGLVSRKPMCPNH